MKKNYRIGIKIRNSNLLRAIEDSRFRMEKFMQDKKPRGRPAKPNMVKLMIKIDEKLLALIKAQDCGYSETIERALKLFFNL